MKKLLFAVTLILGIGPAQAVVIDTFVLNMTAGTPGAFNATSNVSLDLGTTYEVTVAGTFEIGCISPDPCPTDADYYVPGAGSNAGNPYSLTGFDSPTGTDIGATINGVKVDWGPFQASRVYSILFVGLGAPISLGYIDTNYGDNRGSLDVSIATIGEVPIPAALPLFLSAIIGLGIFRRRLSDRTA